MTLQRFNSLDPIFLRWRWRHGHQTLISSLWGQLLEGLPEGSEERRLLQERLEAIADGSS